MTQQGWNKVKSEFAIWRVAALPGLGVIAAIVLLRWFGTLQFWELTALDKFLRLRPPERLDERIVIIGINEQDIQTLGKYPIPDREIANLLKTLQTYRPTVIGLDIFRDLPVEPGHAELTAVWRSYKNVIAIEKALTSDVSGYTVSAPAVLPPEQVGFADAILDSDGYLRRSLLGTSNAKGEFRFSLSIRLAQAYLARWGFSLDNGLRDREAMRFGSTEFPRVQPHTGGYVDADAGGVQMLLNFHSGRQPFRVLSLGQIKSGQVDPAWIRDRIVLIGITALSVKDVVNSAAIPSPNPGLVNGVEIQAHTVSQLVSAVLDGRPLLQVWSDGWEVGWIILWGMVGISLGRFVRSAWKSLLILTLLSLGLVGLCYGLLLLGWWVPIVPALLVLLMNGAGPTALLFYRHDQDLKFRLQERQFILEHTFNTIHNGPLQTLATLLRAAETQNLSSDQLQSDLGALNQELRAVYETVRRETLDRGETLHLGNQRDLDLQAPLHEILYEVYTNTLERDFPGFQTIKVKVVKFDPLNGRRFSIEQKRGLCRFLEEALCNVGKYAIDATRLNVLCAQEGKHHVIRVSDNGVGINPDEQQAQAAKSGGYGTRQANNLARLLGGKFRRFANQPKGTVCELTWPANKFWFW